jgi:hypothetical protein
MTEAEITTELKALTIRFVDAGNYETTRQLANALLIIEGAYADLAYISTKEETK